jgi:hypothetical protein
MTLEKFCRIAIRVEGEMINAYLAPLENMEGAILLGSIRHKVCRASRPAFDAFRALMQQAFNVAAKDALGVEAAKFDIEPAPEHERSGRG